MATKPILIKHSRDPLFGFSKDQALSFLHTALEGRCEAAYLYGSFARDELDAQSDIDCIVVADTHLPFPERPSPFNDLRKRLPSL